MGEAACTFADLLNFGRTAPLRTEYIKWHIHSSALQFDGKGFNIFLFPTSLLLVSISKVRLQQKIFKGPLKCLHFLNTSAYA